MGNISLVEKAKIENDADATLFFGGLPTNIELAKLREAYPEKDMKVGDVILYAEIEKIIGVKRGEARYRSITNRWRRVVESETNLVIRPGRFIDAQYANCFVVLSENQKVEYQREELRRSGRAARRSYVIGSRVDRKGLDDNYLAILDHSLKCAAQIHSAAQIRKNIALPTM